MKAMKRVSTAVLLVGALAFTASPVLASPTLCYYGFPASWKSGAFNSPNFIATNASNVVTIYGWQDTKSTAYPASVQYTLYEDGYVSNTLVGSTRINGNYPQGGNWYKYTFTGVVPDREYFLKMTNYQPSAVTSGAGNAYDGY